VAFELSTGRSNGLGLGFHEALGTATFKKGDGPLDEMLEDWSSQLLWTVASTAETN